jgi:hypothetical protein
MGRYHQFLRDIGREGEMYDRAVAIILDGTEAGYLPNTAGRGGLFDETADSGVWLVTVIDGGGDNGETITIADDVHGGALAFVTNDADNDALNIQHNGEMIGLAANRRVKFQVEFKLDDVSTVDWFFGLSVNNTGVLASLVDGIGFRCPDSTGDIDYVTCKDSGETTADTTKDLTDDTYVKLMFEVFGTGEVRFFVNNDKVATIATTLPDNEVMSPIFQIRNSSAATSTLTMKTLLAAADV